MSKKQKSTKQLWVSERLFCHAGTLKSIVTKLESIKNAKSTLPIEFEFLGKVVNEIKKIKMSDRKIQSWNIYKERNEKDES